jgi:gamma-glutamyltranspeptidase
MAETARESGIVKSRFMRSKLVLAAIAAVLCLEAAQPVRAHRGMVVSSGRHATEAGLKVLESGGNAVDAAVDVGFALAVTHSSAGNIGGGGFMLLRLADGRTTFIDFRERAPAAASRNMYLDASGKATADSTIGYRASGVPGTVRGLEYAARKYGRKPRADLVRTDRAQHLVDFGMNVQDAVDWPRFHHQWMPDELRMEPGYSPDTVALLEKRGYTVRRAASQGEVAAVMFAAGWLEGAADPRTEATAEGY